jgi:TPR repeat protein
MKAALIGLALGLAAGPAFAGFDEGVDAYNRGDFVTAMANFKPLAVQGDPRAQFNVGLMYEDGRGVLQSFKDALLWYRVAAQQGNPRAQNNIGFMYCYGRGVQRDFREAMSWYRLSAEQEYPRAQFNIGLMYEEGMGVEKDYVEARKWYRLAAGHEDPGALFRLAFMTEQGLGAPADPVQAHVLYGAAAARYAMGPDRDRAQERRAAIAAMLSPEQLGEAQQQLAERDGAMTAGASAGGEAAVVKTAAPAR